MRSFAARTVAVPLQQQLVTIHVFSLSLLLVVDCGHRTQGQKGNNERQERRFQHGLGDFTDENAEVLNPLHQTDFVEQQQCVEI
jgi:hypothetical protein